MSVSRHLLVVVLSALLPLLAVALVLSVLMVRDERAATERALLESSQRLSQAVDAELERSFAALAALSRSEPLQRGDLKAFYRQARDVRDGLRIWDNVLLLSPQAEHLLNLARPFGEALPPVPQPEGALTVVRTGRPYVSDVIRGRVETDWLMYIAYPVVRDGEVRYVIGVTMGYRYWSRWLVDRVPQGAIAGIVDGQYNLLARTQEPERFVGRPVQSWYRDVLAAGARSGFARGPSVGGTDVVVAYHRSGASRWAVNVLTPGAVMDAPMKRVALYVSLALGLALFIAIGFSLTRARLIERVYRGSAERLHESEAKFRNITHVSPAIVWTTDERGLAFVNERWTELTGQPAERALGQGYVECVHPEDHQRLAPMRERARRTGEPYEGEIRYRSRDGQYRWHAFRAVPAGGDLKHWFGCAVDVHEAREAREALREADRRKDEFLATLAHELRNPLAPIRNSLFLLAQRPSPDATLRAAQAMMERQVAHMVRLIDDLLDVSRITRGRLELHREPVELKKVVEQAVETSRPHISQQLTLVLPSEPVFLDADSVRLSQVLSNLLNNAAKFTPRNGDIRVCAALEGGRVAIRVRDTGIGFSNEVLPQLFRMFAQAGAPLERTKGGLGIGLALARSLVELHGGTIDAHSEGPGKGSEFVVRLPVLPTPDPSQAPAAEPARAYDGAVRRVLVVDDVPDNAQSLATLLRMDGNHVEVAADGLQAVEMAERFKPDLILLDLGLPNLNGLEACELIRKQPWGKGIVIVAVTGWGQEADRRRTLEAGFDEHLVKPVHYDTLRKLLASPLMA